MDVFSTQFNLSFKQPANKACDTCDSFQIKINDKEHCYRCARVLAKDYESHMEEAKKRSELTVKERITLNKKIVAPILFALWYIYKSVSSNTLPNKLTGFLPKKVVDTKFNYFECGKSHCSS